METKKEKKSLSLLSISCGVIALLGCLYYYLIWYVSSYFVLYSFPILAVIAVFLPIISRFFRLRDHKSGVAFEIISLIIGDLMISFYISIVMPTLYGIEFPWIIENALLIGLPVLFIIIPNSSLRKKPSCKTIRIPIKTSNIKKKKGMI